MLSKLHPLDFSSKKMSKKGTFLSNDSCLPIVVKLFLSASNLQIQLLDNFLAF